MNPSPTFRDRLRTPWTIFWVAFGLRVITILVGRTYHIRLPIDHFGFGWEMGRIARSLYRGQGYANPFNGISGPTAWTPPLYPLLMAGAFKMFGLYTNAAAFFLLTVNSFFSALVCPALFEIAARCFDSYGIARRQSKYATPVALWSAWMWAAYPAFLQYAIHWLWEMSLTTCLFTWMLVFALRLRHIGENSVQPDWPTAANQTSQAALSFPSKAALSFRGQASESASTFNRATTLQWLAYGTLWALVALSNASLLICLPFFTAWIVWPALRHRNLRCLLLGPLLAGIVFCAVMSPWWIRNERVFHTFIPTRGEFGIELDESQIPSHSSFPWGTSLPLFWGAPQFLQYKQMGEVAYSHMRGREGMARIRAHPGYFLHRDMDLFFFFWDGTPHPPDRHPVAEYFRNFSYSLISVCGLLGVALALRRKIPAANLWLLLFAVLPIPYYIITPGPRFRHPMEPIIVLLGVYLFRSADTTRRFSAKLFRRST
jgi:hypothetical protein